VRRRKSVACVTDPHNLSLSLTVFWDRNALLPTLLIAEDNTDLAQALRRKAESCGWTVTLCPDGAALVDALPALASPALLLIDVNMPRLNGIEAIERVAAAPRPDRMRIRFMTGGSDVNAAAARMIAEARNLDVGETLYKPLPMPRFTEVLESEARRLCGLDQSGGA
jgi:CheY-like chemotaxis protein